MPNLLSVPSIFRQGTNTQVGTRLSTCIPPHPLPSRHKRFRLPNHPIKDKHFHQPPLPLRFNTSNITYSTTPSAHTSIFTSLLSSIQAMSPTQRPRQGFHSPEQSTHPPILATPHHVHEQNHLPKYPIHPHERFHLPPSSPSAPIMSPTQTSPLEFPPPPIHTNISTSPPPPSRSTTTTIHEIILPTLLLPKVYSPISFYPTYIHLHSPPPPKPFNHHYHPYKNVHLRYPLLPPTQIYSPTPSTLPQVYVPKVHPPPPQVYSPTPSTLLQVYTPKVYPPPYTHKYNHLPLPPSYKYTPPNYIPPTSTSIFTYPFYTPTSIRPQTIYPPQVLVYSPTPSTLPQVYTPKYTALHKYTHLPLLPSHKYTPQVYPSTQVYSPTPSTLPQVYTPSIPLYTSILTYPFYPPTSIHPRVYPSTQVYSSTPSTLPQVYTPKYTPLHKYTHLPLLPSHKYTPPSILYTSTLIYPFYPPTSIHLYTSILIYPFYPHTSIHPQVYPSTQVYSSTPSTLPQVYPSTQVYSSTPSTLTQVYTPSIPLYTSILIYPFYPPTSIHPKYTPLHKYAHLPP